MANNNGDLDWGSLNTNTIATKYITNPITSGTSLYDRFGTTADPYQNDASINDITGAELLEVIQKGLYKVLVGRRDDAKAVWEEEDDDASYGEYKALKDAVELVDAFIRNAANARYSGLRRDRFDGYGKRF
jgi:hypothetical protein